MKGFIELTVDARRILLATDAIVAVQDTQLGCQLTLSSPTPVFPSGASTYLDLSYDEVLDLIQKAH